MRVSALPTCGLVTDGLGHRYRGGPWLFQNLDLRFDVDQVYALVGPSGCGKSTLLSILAGWTHPAAGMVSGHASGRTVWVFQNPHGVPGRSAIDHVMFPLVVRGVSRREARPRAEALLDKFDLGDAADRPFAHLSGGEAQRLMLAQAIAARPALLLVDEPTAQLDRAASERVSGTLHALAGSGAIVVVATHDEVARSACHHVIDLAAPVSGRTGGVR